MDTTGARLRRWRHGGNAERWRQYHEPVRVFLLVRSHAEHDANDLTQEFCAELLASNAWRRADRARGKFRTFLLGMLCWLFATGQFG